MACKILHTDPLKFCPTCLLLPHISDTLISVLSKRRVAMPPASQMKQPCLKEAWLHQVPVQGIAHRGDLGQFPNYSEL